jgi:uncharacterized YccA/Bax inhibitor family protein
MTPFQERISEKQKKIGDIRLRAKTLTDDVSELFDLYYKLGVITVTEKASSAISASITVMVILFLLMFTLLFGGLGLGWFLGERLNSMLAGYGIVSGIFISLIIIVLAARKTLLFPFIRNIIIRKVYE